jgi:RNA-directed DNA polymerase
MAWTPDEGTPQGAVISPLLSNIYLDPLDHAMAGEGFEMVRYADDFVVLCRSEAQAAQALAAVAAWTAQAGLTLHPDKTQLIDARTQSFEFLGYRFANGRRWPRERSLTKLRDSVRSKTRRTAGQSLRSIIDGLNPVLRGWFAYFLNSYRTTFSALDGWIRGRLRSLLRHRRGGRGIARGDDHHRWSNAFFAEHGLFSLQRAHVLAGQSPCG